MTEQTSHGRMGSTVAIIGGGLSGAGVAYHLARVLPEHAARIVVIEPQAELGRGLAYSTLDADHKLNVPDHRMSISNDDPAQFQRWLRGPGAPALPEGSVRPGGAIFAPRRVFGQYVVETLAPFLASGAFHHIRRAATAVTPDAGRFRVTLDDGSVLVADQIVLAVTHPKPALPRELSALEGDPALLVDAFAPDALAAIGPEEEVLIVGSGLTSADIVATLRRQGHRGRIHALSRHGWRSQPHGPEQAETAADFTAPTETTAHALLRRVRRALREDAARGLSWHAVFDRLRVQAPAIWAALPLVERRRFLRHLRSLWDVHRFRIAPQTFEAVGDMQVRGGLDYVTGRIEAVRSEGGRHEVDIRLRHGRGRQTIGADRVILATGPAHSRVTATNPLLASMVAEGLVAADPLGLGLLTAPTGEAVGADGRPAAAIHVAGPLARGTLGELMGVPEVTVWAQKIADRVAGKIGA